VPKSVGSLCSASCELTRQDGMRDRVSDVVGDHKSPTQRRDLYPLGNGQD